MLIDSSYPSLQFGQVMDTQPPKPILLWSPAYSVQAPCMLQAHCSGSLVWRGVLSVAVVCTSEGVV